MSQPIRLVIACLSLCALYLAGCMHDPARSAPAVAGAQGAASTAASTVMATPTATPTATNTATPTNTPTPTATPTVTPTPTAAPAAVLLEGTNHQYQTYNNCGPASIAEALGYYGIEVSQGELNQQGLRALTSPSRLSSALAATDYGVLTTAYALPPTDEQTLNLLRSLLANHIPVIALQRLNFDERMSHYRLIQGYDDEAGVVIADDPYYGPGYRLSYKDFLALFPGTRPPASYMPVYKPEQASFVERLMAEWGATRR